MDHRAACRHGGSDTHDPFVLFGQFHQCMPEDILIELRLVEVVHDDALAGFLVELAGCVPFGGRLFGRFETFPFGCLDMQQLGALQIFYIVQQLDHIIYIVPVYRPEVTDAETFKQVMLLCK